MRNWICAAIAVALVAGAAPAMAQAVQSTEPPTPTAAQMRLPDTSDGQWMLLQGYSNHGEVHYTWYYVTAPNLSRYHGS